MAMPARFLAGGLIVLGVVATVALATDAHAGFPVSRKVTCAVGGEEFTYTTTGSYSTWGSRPDGLPYGSWQFPLALPDCPGNGLVMYREFEPDEISRLEEWLVSPEFAAIRKEGPYYRASAIARFLKPEDAYGPLNLLLRASWGTFVPEPAAKARYQREFAEAVHTLPAEQENPEWYALTARAANAWRELGEFERASATLGLLPETLTVGAQYSEGWDNDDIDRATRYWADYRTGLSVEIAARNTDSEPLAMVPEEVRASKCIDIKDAATGDLPAACTDAETQKIMARFRKNRAEYD